MPRPTTRLLGIHPGALGDVILFGHLLTSLRAPGMHITLAADGEKARLLTALGVVDEPVNLNSLPLNELFIDEPAAPSALSLRLPLCTRLISCFAVGNRTARRRLASACCAQRADFLPVRPDVNDRRLLLTVWAERLGLPGPKPVPVKRWSLPAGLRAAAAELLAARGVDATGRFIAMHVGSGSADKCWPIDRFVHLAQRLDLPFVFLTGPVERERLGNEAAASFGEIGALIDNPSLTELAGILAAATAFVGNDSGPTHLAAAVGTAALAIFGPTDPAQFSPQAHVAERVRVMGGRPLEAVTVAEVNAELHRLMVLSRGTA